MVAFHPVKIVAFQADQTTEMKKHTTGMPSLPPQMGVCLAQDQRLAVSNPFDSSASTVHPSKTSQDKNSTSIPKVLCIGNLRHVAPYFVEKELAVGKLAQGKTIEQALGRNTLPVSEGSGSSVVKNAAFVDWWLKELDERRLMLTKIGKQRHGAARSSSSSNSSSTSTTSTTIATPQHLIAEGEVLRGRYHFHEQSVLANPRPTIVYNDDCYIVVNKPGGLDVLSNPDAHRVVNSLPGIVGGFFDHGTDKSSASTGVIIPAHRIDNPVSGLVCCGKTNKDAKRLSRRIQLRDTVKTYLARVKISARATGKLDHLPFDVEIPLGFDKSRGYAFADFSKSGKPSRTSILAVLTPPLDHDGTCVIAVRPHTGRKHQLRKHLSHVGLPIANDAKYNTIDESYCFDSPKKVSAFGLPNPPKELVILFEDNYFSDCAHCNYVRDLLKGKSNETETIDQKVASSHALELAGKDIGPCVSQPIWLHSWRYKFQSLGLSFEAPPPAWADLSKSKVIEFDAREAFA